MTAPTAGPFDEGDGDLSVNESLVATDIGRVVRVTALGRDTVEVPFEEPHCSVQHYLDAAGATVTRKQMVTLNGNTIRKMMRRITKVTAPGAVIVVANKVKNG